MMVVGDGELVVLRRCCACVRQHAEAPARLCFKLLGQRHWGRVRCGARRVAAPEDFLHDLRALSLRKAAFEQHGQRLRTREHRALVSKHRLPLTPSAGLGCRGGKARSTERLILCSVPKRTCCSEISASSATQEVSAKNFLQELCVGVHASRSKLGTTCASVRASDSVAAPGSEEWCCGRAAP